MRLAIFGGTFDPIHDAHLAVARAAADAFHLDRVLFVPAHHPPHKPGGAAASYEHRLRMVEIACGADSRFEASRLEEGTERSYSIDTIRRAKPALGPDDVLFFLIGADAFAEVESWRRFEDVAREVEFIVVSRPGHRIIVPRGVTVHSIDGIAHTVSSSELRRRLAAGASPAEVPALVLDYIRDHKLYRPDAGAESGGG